MKKLSDFEKISQVIEAKGIKISKAEQISGFGVGTISKLKTRDGKLHEENAKKFLRSFRINPNWWATGSGDMFLPEVVANP